MSNHHYVVVAVTLAVLGGVALGWRVWTEPPPVPKSTIPATTAENPPHPTPPPGVASPAPGVPSVQPAPAPACADCGEVAVDPRQAEAARRSDFYQDYADQLRAKTAGELAQQWPEVVARDDPDELPAFLAVFAQSLREAGNAALYQELAGILRDPNATVSAQAAVLTLLGRTATPPAMQILTDHLASGTASEDLEETLRESIREAAATLMDGQWNWDVSPVLESAWRSRDPTLAEADRAVLAQGIAYLSTAEGARVLLDTARSIGTPNELDRAIAIAALASLQRNETVPVLAEALAGGQSDTQVTAAAMAALVNIGSSDAHMVLIGYLTRVADLGEEQRQTLRAELAGRGLSDEGAKVIRDAVEHQSFADSAIKDLLADALKAE
jgi:hypothetical protein